MEKQSESKEAQDFEKGFWDVGQLQERFRNDPNEVEYKGVLDWLSSIHETIRTRITSIKDREATFLKDFKDARDFLNVHSHDLENVSQKAPEEVSKFRAFAIRTLWKDLLEEGTSPELFSESAYEQWKQSRVSRSEK
ncbi:MAG: hypothetical protein Q7R73_03885 [bacterium]|nr:hypothetical protein [bacterium]